MAKKVETAGTRVVKLDYPLQDGNRSVTEIAIGRPKVRDVIAAQKFKTPAEQMLAMVASMSGLTLPVLLELDVSDFTKLEVQLAPLVSGISPSATEADGEPSSP